MAGIALPYGALMAYRFVAQRLRLRRFPLGGRGVLITGGSRGLGLLMAEEFVRRGANVVLLARNPIELDRAKRRLLAMAKGNRIDTVTCDLEHRGELVHAVRAARTILGSIDVLVNDAGIIEVGPWEEMLLEDFERALGVHVYAPLIAIKEVVPEMRTRGEGRIVNISSVGGLVSVPHLLPYSTSKFALTGLSEGLQVELAKDGILVTTVCPGLMRTGSTYRARFRGKHRQEHAWFALSASTPLTSMSAQRAARAIVDACQRGDSHLVLSWQAKLLAKAKAIAPRSVLALLSLSARMLPGPGGIGKESREGKDSTSSVAPSLLTVLSDRAALQNGEI